MQKKVSRASKLIVEGNIAAGKSTLCEYIRSANPDKIGVLPEIINEKFLQLFYADPAKYGFAFQLHMLEHRTNVNKLHFLVEQENYETFMLDRSVLGDFVFACVNYLTGSISQQEFDVYKDMCGCADISQIGRLLDKIYSPDNWNLLYLHSPFDDCKQRIENIRKGVEQGLPDWYYECIEQVYFCVVHALMQTHADRVVVSHWDHYSEKNGIFEDVCSTIRKGCLRTFSYSTNLSRRAHAQKEIPAQIDEDRLNLLKIPWISKYWRRETLKMLSHRTTNASVYIH